MIASLARRFAVVQRELPALSLTALFATVAIGEGLAQGALGVVLGSCALRCPEAMIALRRLWSAWSTRWLLAFLAWAMVSMVLNRYGLPHSRDGTKLYNLLPLVAVPIAATLAGARAKQQAVLASLVALALASLFALLQYRYGISWFAKMSGTPEIRWIIPLDPSETRFMAGGFFFNRIKFSAALVAGLSLAAFAAQSLGKRARLLAFACIGLAVLGLLVSFARAASFALFVGLSATWLLTSGRRGLLLFGAVLLVTALGIVLLPGVGDRLGTAFASGAYADRLFLWARAREIIADHPFIGVGFGNYGNICSPYYDRVDPSFEMRTQAHNQFLTVLAETGPVGLLFYVALLVAIFVERLRAARAGSLYARAAICALFAFLVISLVHDPVHTPAISLAFFSVFGLGAEARGNRT